MDWVQSGPVTKFIGELADKVHAENFSTILTHHANKTNNTYRDSTAIGAVPDLIMTMSKGKGQNGRKIEVSGRIDNVKDFELRFVDGRYELENASAFLPMEEKVYQYIEDNPGCSSTEIRAGVSGSSTAKDEAVQRLVDGNRIYQRSESGGKLAHHVVPVFAPQDVPVGDESSISPGTP